MKNILILISTCLLFIAHLNAQAVRFVKNSLQSVQVSSSIEQMRGKQMAKVVKTQVSKLLSNPLFQE